MLSGLSCILYSFPLHAPLLLPSSVTLSYFIRAFPMRECLGQHSCMGSTFSITILDGQCFFCFFGIIFVVVGQYRYAVQTSNNDLFVYTFFYLNLILNPLDFKDTSNALVQLF